MQQKKEMFNEGQTGGGAGSVQPSASENEKSWLKYVAFGAIFIALAVGIILAILK